MFILQFILPLNVTYKVFRQRSCQLPSYPVGRFSFVECSVHNPAEQKESLKYHLKFSCMKLKNDAYNGFITLL